MIIAIDYDNTYTADPESFNKIIKILLDQNHQVICVTGREDAGVMAAPVMESIGKLVPVIFAGKEWKRDAAKRRGWNVDVWIDDSPEYIGKQTLIGIH